MMAATESFQEDYHGPAPPHRRLREGPRQGREILRGRVRVQEDCPRGPRDRLGDLHERWRHQHGAAQLRGLGGFRPRRRQELRRRAPFRHPGRGSCGDAEADRGRRRQVLLRPRRRAHRQFRTQVQGPGWRDLRYLEARLAGHRQLQQEVTGGYFFFRATLRVFLAGRLATRFALRGVFLVLRAVAVLRPAARRFGVRRFLAGPTRRRAPRTALSAAPVTALAALLAAPAAVSAALPAIDLAPSMPAEATPVMASWVVEMMPGFLAIAGPSGSNEFS